MKSHIDLIIEHYGKSGSWAKGYLELLDSIRRNLDVFQDLCNESRNFWADAATNEQSVTSARFAYYRGKSDVYADLPKSFLNSYLDQIEAMNQGEQDAQL